MNLSPIISQYYTFFPRKTKEIENYFYEFNETKYAFIHFNIGNLKIKEDDNIIFEKREESFNQIFEFKKDKKYYLYFNSFSTDSHIHFEFYNESKFFKYNKNDNLFMLYGDYSTYYLEIDISDYNINEYILLHVYDTAWCSIEYQYKNDFKQNNFISLGEIKEFNYIPIKKTKNDSLLLYARCKSNSLFSLIKVVKEKVIELSSDSNIIGPKFIFLDYYKLNKLNSFGIESNHPFYFYEQEIGSQISFTDKKYQNMFISKINDVKPHLFKRAFIYLNETINYNFKIKRFNFPILHTLLYSYPSGYQYFQLFQGEDTQKELYFYINDEIQVLFTPVFGNYDSFFINENDINSLLDFDFDKIKESNFFHTTQEKGYLKIKAKEPSMIKKSFYSNEIYFFLRINQRYYFTKSQLVYSEFTFLEELINKTIPIKFSLYGTNPNTILKLYLNDTLYELGNTPLELEYIYKEHKNNLIYFEIGKELEETLLLEIVVGLMKDNYSSYEEKDFKDINGNIICKSHKNLIIKIPKDYDDSMNDYSIIMPEEGNYINIEILYDKMEFMVSNKDIWKRNIPVIPLFKMNPYLNIPNNIKSNDKYFYILIYNYYKYDNSLLYIKKHKIFTNVKLNKINTLPQLKGENEKYYYRIPLPKGDYNSLLVQLLKNNSIEVKISLSKNGYTYPLFSDYYKYNNIPIDKSDISNNNTYINYYESFSSDGYITFIPVDEMKYIKPNDNFKFNMEVKQKDNDNILKIKINSYSYFNEQRPSIYFLIINKFYSNSYEAYSLITGNKKCDEKKHEIMLRVEDNGLKEKIEYEVKIDIKLKENDYYKNNKITIIPVDKDSYISDFNYIETIDFDFTYKDDSTFIFIIIFGVILLLIVIIALLVFRCVRKKRKEPNIENELQGNIMD